MRDLNTLIPMCVDISTTISNSSNTVSLDQEKTSINECEIDEFDTTYNHEKCYVMLCYVMLCYVMLCYVMLCYVMLCYVMLCYVMLCYVMLCYVMLHPVFGEL